MKETRIKKRSDNRYEYRQTINGVRHSVYGKNKAEVKRNIKDLHKDVAKGNVITHTQKLKIALESYLYDVKQNKVKIQLSIGSRAYITTT